MKIILFLFCISIVFPLRAQKSGEFLNHTKTIRLTSPEYNTAKDSTYTLRSTDSLQKTNNVSELFGIGKKACQKGPANPMGRYASFKGHWSGFYYGFVNIAKLSECWNDLELDWNRSFAMQFNAFKYNINLSKRNHFGLVTGLGLEYQRLRFNNNYITIEKSNNDLNIIDLHEQLETGSIKRSSFKNLYLTIPLLLEIQFPAKHSKKMYVSGGIMGGVRMHSKTKIVYEDNEGNKHKQKKKGNFNTTPFKADAIARLGFKNINVWGSYTLTNMFYAENTPDLHLYTVGVGLSF